MGPDRKYTTPLSWFIGWTQCLHSFSESNIFKNCHKQEYTLISLSRLWLLTAWTICDRTEIAPHAEGESTQIVSNKSTQNICFQPNASLAYTQPKISVIDGSETHRPEWLTSVPCSAGRDRCRRRRCSYPSGCWPSRQLHGRGTQRLEQLECEL